MIRTFEIYTPGYSRIVQAETLEAAVSVFRSQTNDAVICVYDCEFRDEQYLERRKLLIELLKRNTRTMVHEDRRREKVRKEKKRDESDPDDIKDIF